MTPSSRSPGLWPVVRLGPLLVALGCQGFIGSGPPGTESSPGAVDDPDSVPPGYVPSEPIPLPLVLRRLTNAEYDASVALLLGVEPAASERFSFRHDVVDAEGYDNGIDTLGLSEARATEYSTAAQSLVQEVMRSSADRDRVIGCDLESEGRACLEAFIGRFGRKAFRRPLEAEEVERLVAVADQAPVDAGAFGPATLALEAILQSPNFLFRIEFGEPDPGHPNRLKLTGYEMASRLSFLLWGSGPDDGLLDAAAAGNLDDANGVAETARTLLEGSGSEAGLSRFVERWLRLTELKETEFGNSSWNDALTESASTEITRLVLDHMKTGEDFLGLLDSRHSFIDDDLADIYGVPGPAEPFDRVDFSSDVPRPGLLTRAGFLALTGHGGDLLAPVLRGKFIREVFLCEPVPPPPDNVGEPPELGADASVRDRWAPLLESDSACGGCHNLLNPVGYGLERYSAFGRYREEDDRGNTLTGEGVLPLNGELVTFSGASGLSQLLKNASGVSDCVGEQLHRYVHGRPAGARDNGTLRALGDSFADSGHRFRELLVALVQSDSFRFGLPQGSQP